jgi:hypothetical protein
VFAGAGLVLVYSHSGRLADAALLMAAALGGVSLVALWVPIDMRPVLPALTMYLCGVMLSGYDGTFSDVPMMSFFLAAHAPLFLAFVLIPLRRAKSGWQQALIYSSAILAPIAVALALAIRAEGFALGF